MNSLVNPESDCNFYISVQFPKCSYGYYSFYTSAHVLLWIVNLLIVLNKFHFYSLFIQTNKISINHTSENSWFALVSLIFILGGMKKCLRCLLINTKERG